MKKLALLIGTIVLSAGLIYVPSRDAMAFSLIEIPDGEYSGVTQSVNQDLTQIRSPMMANYSGRIGADGNQHTRTLNQNLKANLTVDELRARNPKDQPIRRMATSGGSEYLSTDIEQVAVMDTDAQEIGGQHLYTALPVDRSVPGRRLTIVPATDGAAVNINDISNRPAAKVTSGEMEVTNHYPSGFLMDAPLGGEATIEDSQGTVIDATWDANGDVTVTETSSDTILSDTLQ